MKKFYVLSLVIFCFFSFGFSQNRAVFTEHFDGNACSFTFSPAQNWFRDTVVSVSGRRSAWGVVPNAEGDSIELISPVYDLSRYAYAFLRFSHICKVSEQDMVSIEYREDYMGAKWKKISVADYRGTASTYFRQECFNQNSYIAWLKNDLMAKPDNSWWKTEAFDVTQDVAHSKVQFKFKLKKGSSVGTNFAWGWFIDDFELTCAVTAIAPPVVELMKPYVSGVMSGPGPYEIMAKCASRTLLPLENPILRYTCVEPGGKVKNDSLPMLSKIGDSIWVATVPRQKIGSRVSYSVYAGDTAGNNASAVSAYQIARAWESDSDVVVLLSVDAPQRGSIAGQANSVEVSIQNRGQRMLQTADISWSVNGVKQNTYHWKGALDEGLDAKVRIGNFVPRTDGYDTIEVWVSRPNGKANTAEDTLITRYTYGCSRIFKGVYTVGSKGDFKDIQEALEAMYLCGMDGNVILNVSAGKYSGKLNFTDYMEIVGAYNHLTVTSATGKAEDVMIVNPNPFNTEPLVYFANARNITLSCLTFVGTADGVCLTDTNSNINIENCRFLLDTETTAAFGGVVIKGKAERIRIAGNFMEGAGYGFYSEGMSEGRMIKSVTFSGNEVVSPAYGCYMRYTDFDEVNHNRVLNRTVSVPQAFYGLNMAYCTADEVCGNAIRTRTEVSSGQGINAGYFNRGGLRKALFANNEIIFRSKGAAYGFHVSFSAGKYVNNTVIMLGKEDAHAVYCNSSILDSLYFCNNNLLCYGSGYPMYFIHKTDMGTTVHLDHNNLYGERYIGYCEVSHTSLDVWKSLTKDVHAMHIRPALIDSSVSAQCAHYHGLDCPRFPSVHTDFADTLRAPVTTVGCYASVPETLDAALTGFCKLKKSYAAGVSNPLYVVLMNHGKTVLDSCEISWTQNGIRQPSFHWKGMLAPFATDTVCLYTFQVMDAALGGSTRLKVWLSAVNGNPSDGNPFNDTLRASTSGCQSALAGMYSIGGDTADFATLDEAVNMLASCGLKAAVEFRLAPGIYPPVTLNAIAGLSVNDNYQLTLTSATGKAEDVVIAGTDTAVLLYGCSRVCLHALTIQATCALFGIYIGGNCNDIRISHCRINANRISTATYGIYLSSGYKRDRIQIVGNHIDGGSYGISFYSGTAANAAAHGRYHLIDSNRIENFLYTGIYAYYSDFESISHNRISASDLAGPYSNGYGLNTYYCNHKYIVGNCIDLLREYFYVVYGMYVNYSNYDSYAQHTTDTTYVLDNDIQTYGSNGFTNSLYLNYGNLQVIHNSLYMKSKYENGYGICLVETSPYVCEVKNNSVYVDGGCSVYPICCSGPNELFRISGNNVFHTCATSSLPDLAVFNNKECYTLAELQGYDAEATVIRPAYFNGNVRERIYFNDSMTAVPVTNQYYQTYGYSDKSGTLRKGTRVTRGAYEAQPMNSNAQLLTFVSPAADVIPNGTTVEVKVVMRNDADSVLTSCNVEWEVNGIRQAPYVWKGKLSKGTADTLCLGKVNVSDRVYDITAYTSLPNGQMDEQPCNDTLSTRFNGCTFQLNGTYVVGNSPAADLGFNQAMDILTRCGISGKVVLKLEKGTYHRNLDFSSIVGMERNASLTLTSVSGRDSDVVIIADKEAPALTLANTCNFTLEKVTLKGYANGSSSTALHLAGNNRNLMVRHCILRTEALNSSNASDVAIYGNSILPDTLVRIIGNRMTGNGGICLNASSAQHGHDYVIDSNEIISPYVYGIYTNYCDIRTICHNYIHKQASEIAAEYGLFPMNTFGVPDQLSRFSCNRVHGAFNYALSVREQYSKGRFGNDTSAPVIISNNEFICSGTSSGNNVVFRNIGGYVLFCNNTLLVPQGATRTYMVMFDAYQSGHFKFMNNNLVNYGTTAYVIYSNWTGKQEDYADGWDYNNYWMGNAAFSWNGRVNSLSAFIKLLNNRRDVHATEADPGIQDAIYCGRPERWGSLLCPMADSVTTDITGGIRNQITYKGAYTQILQLDAALRGFTAPEGEFADAGTAVPLEVTVVNIGSSAIHEITLCWMLDEVARIPVSLNNLNILPSDSMSVSLGSFIPDSAHLHATLAAWCANPNGMQDMDVTTDTIRKRMTICRKAMSGQYRVGKSTLAEFSDIPEVVAVLQHCGIGGPVVLLLETGDYSAFELRDIPGVSAQNTITITSLSGNADMVTIGVGEGTAMKLTGMGHVRVENVTIGSCSDDRNMIAVDFSGKITDVLFRHCVLAVNASSTDANCRVVNYRNTSSSVEYMQNVRFIGNEMLGGYYGFYLYYAGGSAYNCKPSAGSDRTSIRIDSNHLSNQYYYALYVFNFAHIQSFSYNTIESSARGAYYYGAYFGTNNLVDSIVGNHIHVKAGTSSYGMYLYSNLNYTTTFGTNTAPARVANNEVIGESNTQAYGIYAYNANADIFHNSVYCKGNITYAFYVGSMTTIGSLNVKNNIFVADNSNSNAANYLIYFANSSYMTNYKVSIESNCYYAAGQNKNNFYVSSPVNFIQWQNTYNMDAHSVVFQPDFRNLPYDLSIGEFDGMLKCERHPKVLRDIGNNARTEWTLMGAYSTPLFDGHNLQAEVFVEPVVGGIQCFPDRTPVKLCLYNMGTKTADFSTKPMKLYLQCESDSVNFVSSITDSTGSLGILKRDTFELLTSLDITFPGMYRLTAWVEWEPDGHTVDDTLKLDYYVDKAVLPYDNDFSGSISNIAASQSCGNIQWEVSDHNPVLNPVFGTGSLLFRSSEARGSISHALFTSVSLQGTYNPQLYFWYAHDDKNPLLRDQMEVRISRDGGATFKTLQTLYRYDAKCSTPTWKEYKIDLSNYRSGSCIIIAFTAYSFGGGDQSVDRVKIIAQQDMQVLVEEPSDTDFSACNLTGRNLTVYLENLTSQVVPFNAGDSITVEVKGASNSVYRKALTGYLDGYGKDTLQLGPLDYAAGPLDVKVYVNSIDSNASNDTARFSLTLNPDLSILTADAIGLTQPGDTMYASFTMKNVGNLDIVSPFDVRLVVNGEDTITEQVTSALKVGDTLHYTFSQPYIVPATTSDQPFYLLDISTLLSCDANANNDSIQVIGNVDIVDNGILSITNPVNGKCSKGGEEVAIEVRLFNNGTLDGTDSLVLTAVIDSAGTAFKTIVEKIAPMYAGESRTHVFTQKYKVPRLSVNNAQATYDVVVYLGAVEGDIDLSNDTASVESCVEGGVGLSEATSVRWTMEQNVPNPAGEVTRVPFTLPEAGMVTFTIMGMNGQVLYREEISAEAGQNELQVNTSDYAAGIYYYSMEYKGQRLVKKMNIVR